VLIISDEKTVGVGRQSGLAGSGQAEEEGDIASLLADIGRRVEGKLAKLDGLEVMLMEEIGLRNTRRI
jgi:hypothetical protein